MLVSSILVNLLLLSCCHAISSHWRSRLDDMAQRPLVLPEPYDGVTGSWPEWAAHFENVAIVKKWESDDDKLKWLRVRLTGKAQTDFMRFPGAVREKFSESMVAHNKPLNPWNQVTDCLCIYSLYFFSVSQFYTCKPAAIKLLSRHTTIAVQYTDH